jgi:hypothetical protein
MALATARPGRPCAVAVIPFQNQRKVQLLDEFYAVCATFRYRETVALSRALGIHPRTVENWKYKITFPRWDVAVDVIEWVRLGKPVNMVPPSQRKVM